MNIEFIKIFSINFIIATDLKRGLQGFYVFNEKRAISESCGSIS